MEKQSKIQFDEMAVRLLGIIAIRGLPPIQQIAILSRVGFSPKAVAEIIGSTPNRVRVAMVGIRKAERQGIRVGLPRGEQRDE
jgi:hypothetical protein